MQFYFVHLSTIKFMNINIYNKGYRYTSNIIYKLIIEDMI